MCIGLPRAEGHALMQRAGRHERTREDHSVPRYGVLVMKRQSSLSGAREAVDASMSEAEWQAQVIECAERYGWWVYHNPDSRRSTAGYPDLTCVHPQRGVTIFAELKTEDGQLSYEQERWRDALILSGQRWYLWRPHDWPEIEATLKGGM